MRKLGTVKAIAIAYLLGVAVAACSMTAKDGTPIVREGPLPGDGSLIGTIQELVEPGSTYKRREAADDLRCRQLGFRPGTEVYGNCRLQREQIRATERTATRIVSRTASVAGGAGQVGKVYDPSECIGPVIMGRCEGSIVPNKAYHPTCHGAWLNGQCTGPMF